MTKDILLILDLDNGFGYCIFCNNALPWLGTGEFGSNAPANPFNLKGCKKNHPFENIVYVLSGLQT